MSLNMTGELTHLLYMIKRLNTLHMYIVWEEIGDVLHGLGGDRGCTPKPVWEEIGDGLQ